jgi:hypothetical protein
LHTAMRDLNQHLLIGVEGVHDCIGSGPGT